ncbi:hypothetical protein C7N43_13225 [Sphingobacteriales bacterium UPWRP_1]|nr:hypothetical protein BVG80_14735 [Sphingobacteriales bacterium TSM_CSM]PSJ76567.1 hypothetical protein C7N43_13225 [Sphingobacteriales bacterium UPWRP_1]
MQNTKFISLLQTFSKEELKRFDDFIKSPYFNKLEAPVKLYKTLLPQYPNFDDLKWDKLFKKAFPDKPAFSETYLRNVLSDLYDLGLGFLRQEAAEKNQASGEFACVQKLIYRQLYKQAGQQLEKIHEWLEKSWLNMDYNSLLADYYDSKMILHDRAEEQHAYSEAHQQKVNYWEKAIWEKVISLIYETETDKRDFYNFPYNTETLKKILSVFEAEKYTDTPMLLAAYYRAVLVINPNWETFNALHELLKTESTKMPDNQVYSCYMALLGYTSYVMRQSLDIRKLVALQMELAVNAVELRKRNNLHLIETHYHSIAVNGYELYGFDWAMQYIDAHVSELLPYLQEGLPAYSKAFIWFREKNYRETIALLSGLPNFRSDLYFSVKPILLMCYYETEDTDAAEFMLNTLRKTYKNHPNLKIGAQEALKHFIEQYGQLVKLRIQFNPQKAIALKDAILQPATPLFAKQWLLDKITALETAKQKSRHFAKRF